MFNICGHCGKRAELHYVEYINNEILISSVTACRPCLDSKRILLQTVSIK